MGTGTYGANNPTVINCGFKPKVVYIFAFAYKYRSPDYNIQKGLMGLIDSTGTYFSETKTNAMLFVDDEIFDNAISIGLSGDLNVTFTDNGVSIWSSNSSNVQLNGAGNVSYWKYFYYAFG
nr:MAG TPA: hypothetical protein [Caudoviricetes sp.]